MLSLVLSSALGGKIFDARNCNAAASTSSNWQGPSPVAMDGVQPPGAAVVTDSAPFFDNSAPYSVGSLRLSAGSSVSFAESGTQIKLGARGASGTTTFLPQGSTVETATGEVADGCDFKCASNWLIGTADDAQNFAMVADSLSPAHSAPCSTDDVYFPTGYGVAAHATGNIYVKSMDISMEGFTSNVKITDGMAYAGNDATDVCAAEGSFSHVNGACLCEDDCASHAQQAEFVDAKRTALTDAAHNNYDAWYKTVENGIVTFTWTNVPDFLFNAAEQQVSSLAGLLAGAFVDVDYVSVVKSEINRAEGSVTVGLQATAFCGFFATPEYCASPDDDFDAHTAFVATWDYDQFANHETAEAARVVANRLFGLTQGKTTALECRGMSDQDIQTILGNRQLLAAFSTSAFNRLSKYRFQSLNQGVLESSFARPARGVISVNAQYDDMQFADDSERAHANNQFICQALGFYKLPTGAKDPATPCKYEYTGFDYHCVANAVQAAVAAPAVPGPDSVEGIAAGVQAYNAIFGITDPDNTEALVFMNELDIQAPQTGAPAASSGSDDGTTSAVLFAVAGFAAVVIVGGVFMLHKTGRCGRQY